MIIVAQILILILSLGFIFKGAQLRTRTASQRMDLFSIAEVLEDIALQLRFGTPLHQALIKVTQSGRSIAGSVHLRKVCSGLGRGLSFAEAQSPVDRSRWSPLDSLLDLLLSRAEASPLTLGKAMERIVSLVALARRYDRQERARTTQSRVQFWLVSGLVLGLFLFHATVFPELFVQTWASETGRFGYLLAFLLLSFAFWLFCKLQGQGFSFLVTNGGDGLSQGSSGWKLVPQQHRGLLQNETENLGFLATVEIAMLSGHSLKDSLASGVGIFSGAALSECCSQVLDLESKGATLSEAFELLRGRKDEPAQLVLQLARGARDRALLVETAQSLVDCARERLGDAAEERLGAVGAQLLVPLCFGLLPAAIAVMVAPILHLLQAMLGS